MDPTITPAAQRRSGGQAITIAGWREWVSLTPLMIPWIKAKLDTGARSSALHAENLTVVTRDGAEVACFDIYPWQGSDLDARHIELPVVEWRVVRSSTGHEEERPVVRAVIGLVGIDAPADLTLTNRDEMGFRMLVGRQALSGRVVVDPGRSYLGRRPPREIRRRNRRSPS